jgi:hypothetical protein
MEIDDSPKKYSVNENCFIEYGFVDDMAFDNVSDNETLYIYKFICVFQPVKYNGARMMLTFLQMIKATYPNIRYIQLVSSPSEGIGTDKRVSSDPEKDQQKLNEHYRKLGFVLIDPTFNTFKGNINTIIATIPGLVGGKRIKYQKIRSRKIRRKSRRKRRKGRNQSSRRK